MRKFEVTQSLQRAVMRPVSQITRVSCHRALCAAGQYLYNLRNTGILPYEGSFERQSFSTVARNAVAFPKQRFELCQGVYCECYKVGQVNLKKELRKELETFRNLKEGLCLDCVRSGQVSKLEGTCRIPHLQETQNVDE